MKHSNIYMKNLNTFLQRKIFDVFSWRWVQITRGAYKFCSVLRGAQYYLSVINIQITIQNNSITNKVLIQNSRGCKYLKPVS